MRTEAEMQVIRERIHKRLSDTALAELRDDICTALENQADFVAGVLIRADELFKEFEVFKRRLKALNDELSQVFDPRDSVRVIFEDYGSEEQE